MVRTAQQKATYVPLDGIDKRRTRSLPNENAENRSKLLFTKQERACLGTQRQREEKERRRHHIITLFCDFFTNMHEATFLHCLHATLWCLYNIYITCTLPAAAAWQVCTPVETHTTYSHMQQPDDETLQVFRWKKLYQTTHEDDQTKDDTKSTISFNTSSIRLLHYTAISSIRRDVSREELVSKSYTKW